MGCNSAGFHETVGKRLGYKPVPPIGVESSWHDGVEGFSCVAHQKALEVERGVQAGGVAIDMPLRELGHVGASIRL